MKQIEKQNLSAALINFDLLPDSANVRQPVVQALFACSAPTVWRWVKSGLIPPPLKLSARVTAWNVGALRIALNAIKENRNLTINQAGRK